MNADQINQIAGLVVRLNELLAAAKADSNGTETVGHGATNCKLDNKDSIKFGPDAEAVNGNKMEKEPCTDAIRVNAGAERAVDATKQKSEIHDLQQNNDLLEKLVNVDKGFGLEMIDYSSPNQLESCPPSPNLLPDIIVRANLKKIPTADQQTTMNCRLVCVQWNSVIEDTAELIRRITFPVFHAKPFLDLGIVKKGKVKSIKFTNPLQLISQSTKTLLEIISKTVEKIEIAFEDPDLAQQNELFKLILENCSNLQELIISASTICTDKPQKIFRGITVETNIAAIGIRVLSVNVKGFTVEDANGLVELMLKLPQLKNLELVSYCESYFTIVSGICDYIKNYDSAPQLKNLLLAVGKVLPRGVFFPHQEIFTLLLILCEKHSIELDGQQYMDLDFNSFLEALTTSKLQSHLNSRPLFSTNICGQVTFLGPKLKNLDRFDNLNVHYLRLFFKRDVIDGELAWIKNLGSLYGLIFHKAAALGARRLGVPSITEFENTFSTGLPSVKELCIFYDIFDTIRVFRWSKYFPNVVEIHFDNCKLTPNYLISELTELEFLSLVRLENLPNLTDLAFTIDCVNRFTTGNSAPAICCFKSLTALQIVDCPMLTDECVIHGISKCLTLETLEIQSCGKITEKCFELLKCKVEFNEE